MEWLIAIGLGFAAGTNAYIPLLLTGVLARWGGVITLPDSWAWLADDWALIILASLIVLDSLAARIPLVATANDVLQTALRPTSAGIVVTAQGAGSQVVTDWSEWLSNGHWVPAVVAMAVALSVHLVRGTLRLAADATSAGLAGGILAGVDEVSSVAFSLISILLPLLVPLLVVGTGALLWWMVARRRRSRGSKTPQNN
jgi:hypothetical protein